MRRQSCSRPASAPTTSIPMRATAWPRPPSASCAPSASTSRWAATTTSRPPTPSCCGARTWRRCTRSCGPGSPTAACPRRMCSVAVLSTFEHRSFDLADIPMVFKPQTDLYDPQRHRQPHHHDRPGQPGLRRQRTRCSSAARPTSATGCAREHPLQKKATERGEGQRRAPTSTYDDYAQVRRRLHAGEGRRIVRRAAQRGSRRRWPSSMPTRRRKVMSLWTMGFNQHIRGVWANKLVYNIHLLTGKISEPGNSPFSLTGQPSACGTAREVGTFAASPACGHGGHQPGAPRARRGDLEAAGQASFRTSRGIHAVQQDRMLHDGKLNFYWVQVNNNLQAGAEHLERDLSGLPQPGELHGGVGCLSDRHRAGRRPRSCRRRCGSRRKAPTAMPNAGPISGTSWSTPPARRARTCGS